MEKKWCEGGTVNAARQLPHMAFDWSDRESDIPPEKWCRGGTVNGARQLPHSTLDFGGAEGSASSAAVPTETASAHLQQVFSALNAYLVEQHGIYLTASAFRRLVLAEDRWEAGA